jgi:DMSO/TMAO reductase YedYZ molybdopterin-dependent catalytic subunit
VSLDAKIEAIYTKEEGSIIQQFTKKDGFLVIFALICMATLTLIGCSQPPSTVTVTATPTISATQAVQTGGLTIIKDSQNKVYSLADVKALPAISGFAGQISSTGTISGPLPYKGVAITELLKAVGGITENNAIRVSAKDGYAMTLSYKQITEGNFTTIDSSTGKEVAPAGKLTVFIAYEEDGKSLSEKVGPLRLGIMTSEKQVTEGHWWIKWAEKIEVIPVEKPWNLKLEGAITEDIDQATFESGAAIGCHGEPWKDDQGQSWDGIPLWYLVGRVDDVKDTHKGDAFSDELADQGYEVQVIASDGYTVKFTSKEVKRNDKIIVAYKLDGNPLPEKSWPLKLVGGAVEKQRQVGKITTIKLVFPTATSPTPTETGPAIISIVNGIQTKEFSLAGLKALTATSSYAGQINKNNIVSGPNQYKGITLTELLNSVGGLKAGNSVKVTAKDGYSKTFTYDQLVEGKGFTIFDTAGKEATPEKTPILFIAYEKDGIALDETTGPLTTAVMTCQNQVSQSSNWVKQLVKIEIVAAP